jgi:hypothetical protein
MNADIDESENVAGQYPEIFGEMKDLLKTEYSNLLKGSHIWSRENE